MFVLVPSAHIGVHGLFPSLIISPPAALAENEVIIQQAVRGFPSARRHSAVFSQPRIPVALSSAASEPRKGPRSRESDLGGRVRKALEMDINSPWVSQFLKKLDCSHPVLQLLGGKGVTSSLREKYNYI